MLDNQKRDFQTLMVSTMEIYQKTISASALRIWWSALVEYDFESVRRAFSAHITGKRGQFAPLPADILNHLRAVSGHLSTEEAWALALRSTDEATTVVWTDEIAQALAAARPCLDSGDKFGASKAFAAAYERAVTHAAPTPVWRVSQGYDADQRRIALEAAVSAGQLTHQQVAGLLPPAETVESKAIAGLLTGSTSAVPKTLDPRWKELGQKLRANAQKAAEEREASRLAEAAEFERRRKAAMESIGRAANG